MDTGHAKHRGVYWDARKALWMATIKRNGRNRFLGYSTDHADAVRARLEAERECASEDAAKQTAKEARCAEMCRLYTAGESMAAIGKRLRADQVTVHNALISGGLAIRSKEHALDEAYICRRYQEGATIGAIATELDATDWSIAHRLDRHGIPRRPDRDYWIDETAFDEIDTEWKAYMLGLIMADGNVRKDWRAMTIALTKADAHLLEPLEQRLFGEGGHLSELPGGTVAGKNGKVYQAKPSVRLVACSRRLCEGLGKWGCGPAKSLTLQWPTELPQGSYGAFIRGYFDGDGTISIPGNRVSIISSDAFCAGLARHLHEAWGITSRIKVRGKVSQVELRKAELIKLGQIMYEGATLWLERKRARFPEEAQRRSTGQETLPTGGGSSHPARASCRQLDGSQ